MSSPKEKLFVVSSSDPQNRPMQARLIRAERVSQVESHVLKDFKIEPATADEAHELGEAKVRIERAEMIEE